ncbi:MAG: hypothetical protein MPN21_28390 [Thermoanaerobaculia bacterium]|nr:hypothetical protein [Thermoanaerobaculia bacterium]
MRHLLPIRRRHRVWSPYVGTMLCAVLLASTPAAADTLRGVVYHDRDADGIRADGEPGVSGVRLVAHTDDGRVLAMAESDAEGRFEIVASAEAGTAVRVMATGLGGQYGVRTSPPESVRLEGASSEVSIDVALVESSRLAKLSSSGPSATRPPAVRPGATNDGSSMASMAKIDFPGGLSFPNVGPWVTLRCAGANNLFDVATPVDDRIDTVAAETPGQEPHYIAGSPYSFSILPALGERCRVLAPSELGSVPPGDN